MLRNVLACSLVIASAASAQTEWTAYPTAPVADPAKLDPATPGMYGPEVVMQGSKYHLFYTRQKTERANIGRWTSDDGVAWTAADTAILSPSGDNARFDAKKVGQPSVVVDGDTLRMWYWGAGAGVGSIGYAWSTDGKAWTKVDGPKSNKGVYGTADDGGGAVAIATPMVIKDGSTWRMWYARLSVNGSAIAYTIGHATSPDGMNWTHVAGTGAGGAVLEAGAAGKFDSMGVFFPSVIKQGSTFRMWYSGQSEDAGMIGYATSTDGVAWSKAYASANKGGVLPGLTCSVLPSGDGYKMWYMGEAGVNLALSGIAVGVRPVGALRAMPSRGVWIDAAGKRLNGPTRALRFAAP